MGFFELRSKREKAHQKAGQEDVFQYDELPDPFRIQVIYIWNESLGHWENSINLYGTSYGHFPNQLWSHIYKHFAKEKGLFKLVDEGGNPNTQCCHYLMRASTEDALDLIEFTFGLIESIGQQIDRGELVYRGLCPAEDAVSELNHRFREHGIGYEFVGGEIVRVDSKYLHAEAVRPALQLLYDAGVSFSGPLQEFLGAHERYCRGEQKDAIAWALKAFESTLKAICTARNWTFDPNSATAKNLVDVVFTNGLIPNYVKQQFTALRSVLESGVPTVRNRTSGHGQGPTPTTLPDHLVAYALHLTATNIVFLIESFKTLN